MENELFQLEQCPFCGKLNLLIIDGSFCSLKSYHVYCRNCLVHGPNGLTAKEAVKKWNKPERKSVWEN